MTLCCSLIASASDDIYVLTKRHMKDVQCTLVFTDSFTSITCNNL